MSFLKATLPGSEVFQSAILTLHTGANSQEIPFQLTHLPSKDSDTSYSMQLRLLTPLVFKAGERLELSLATKLKDFADGVEGNIGAAQTGEARGYREFALTISDREPASAAYAHNYHYVQSGWWYDWYVDEGESGWRADSSDEDSNPDTLEQMVASDYLFYTREPQVKVGIESSFDPATRRVTEKGVLYELKVKNEHASFQGRYYLINILPAGFSYFRNLQYPKPDGTSVAWRSALKL